MRPVFLSALILLLPAGLSLGQHNLPLASPNPTKIPSAPIVPYFVGPGVTSPEILPSAPQPVFTGKCKKQDDSVEFVLIVDQTGQPRDITYSYPLVTDAAKLALAIVSADRFMPGVHNGEPVPVEISVLVSLKGCVETVKEESGQRSTIYHLKAQPSQKPVAILRPPQGATPPAKDATGAAIYHVGGDVSAPVPLNTPEARYTAKARKARIEGDCWISLVVDTRGVPQNATVVHGLDPGLDQNALDAVAKYRFKPAMENGRPVPVMITVQVSFSLY